MLGGEPYVTSGHRGQALFWRILVTCPRGQRVGEGMQRAHDHGSEQLVTVGEMPVGCGDRNAQAPTQLGHGEAAHPPLGDQLDGPVDESRLEVAVVVAAVPGRPGVAGVLRRGS
jgi:hypothetical protein